MNFRTPLLVLALASSGAGCFNDTDDVSDENVRLATHVTDWRDEVIYQVLVDRFADGDTSNDVRVNRNALGRYQGGDWQGLIDHMDYLTTLGVTAIWISPIVRNVDTDAGFDGYHGYWAQDLTLLNPHFGDLGTLRRMVSVAHDHGIKVILDIVTNHMGQMFYYDVNNNGRPDELVSGSGMNNDYQNPGGSSSSVNRISEYDPDFNTHGHIQAFTSLGPAGDAPVIFFNMPEIFRVPPRTDILPSQAILARPEGYHRRGRIVSYVTMNGMVNDQTLLGDFPGGLKDVATELPQVRDAMVDAYSRWIELTDMDGFRIDTLKHVEHEFWSYFGSHVRSRLAARGKNNFLMFGEAFDSDDVLVGSFTNPNEMDSVFYFPQKYRVFQDVFQCGKGNTRVVEDLFRERMMHYSATPQPMGVPVSPRQLLVNFMDNHDVSRFLYGINRNVADSDPGCANALVDTSNSHDVDRMRQRLFAALAYLFTEDGIPCLYYGTEQDFLGGNDPSNRERLWDANFRIGGAGTTFDWVRRLIRLRRNYRALRRGALGFTWTTEHAGTEQDHGMLAFERTDMDQYALVVIHAHDGTAQTSTSMMGGNAMTVHQPPGTELVDVLNPDGRSIMVGPGGVLTVELGPWRSAVYVPRAQVHP